MALSGLASRWHRTGAFWRATPGFCTPAPTWCSTRASIPFLHATPFTPARLGSPRAQRRGHLSQVQVDLRGYLDSFGQSVAGRPGALVRVRRPLPAYLSRSSAAWRISRFQGRPRHGDTLVAGSVEVRVPLTSPLNVGKLGVSAFVDVGTVYDKGERLNRSAIREGVRWQRVVHSGVLRLNSRRARRGWGDACPFRDVILRAK